MLEHGGRLREAAEYWGIPLADWVDLSTGIAPWSYPVAIPAAAWQRLPEDGRRARSCRRRLLRPARAAAGGRQPGRDPGLPRLLPPCRVAVLTRPAMASTPPGLAGHELRELPLDAIGRLAMPMS
jgi:cobalamin biosynthetic protein CobC